MINQFLGWNMSVERVKGITDEPVIIADHLGTIIFVNKPFEKLFGWTEREIVGKPITVIIPDSFHDAHVLGFSRFTNTEVSTILNHPLKLNARTKAGKEFLSEHTIFAEKIDGNWNFAAIVKELQE
jgi:PAS domain S-box-containing protein